MHDTTFFKKAASRLNTVAEDEFRTSKLPACCHKEMHGLLQKDGTRYKILVTACLSKQRMFSQFVGSQYLCSYQYTSTVSTSRPREREASSIHVRQCSRLS